MDKTAKLNMNELEMVTGGLHRHQRGLGNKNEGKDPLFDLGDAVRKLANGTRTAYLFASALLNKIID